MDRRAFLKSTALAAPAAAAAGLATPALAQGKRKLVMVTSWGRGLAGVFDAAEKVARDVAAVTDGTLEIEIRGAGELVGAFEVFDAVSAGQADLYHSADYYFVNQHPAFALFTAVPFGMTAQEMHNWYYHDGGMDQHHALGEIFGIKSFLAGNTGPQSGGWFRKPITAPEDFNGLRFRMPGLGGKAMGFMGASIQNIPGAEVYQALASGAIDGTEWIGPWADEKAGFQEITKYYYPAGFHEPGAAISLACNLEVFEGLSPAHQSALEVVAGNTNSWSLAQYSMKNGASLERLKAEGVQVMEFPDSVWDAMFVATQKMLEEYTQDDMFREIYTGYLNSLRASSGWLTASSAVFSRQRDRILKQAG